MSHMTSPDSEEDWFVTISISEWDGHTRATARLQFGDFESVGVGLSGLGPAEYGSEGAGREVAVVRALSDLARRLQTPNRCDEDTQLIGLA
jgi:hypothetical protein